MMYGQKNIKLKQNCRRQGSFVFGHAHKMNCFKIWFSFRRHFKVSCSMVFIM